MTNSYRWWPSIFSYKVKFRPGFAKLQEEFHVLKENVYCLVSLCRWGKEVDPESRNFKTINSASGAKVTGIGRKEGYAASCQMAVPGTQQSELLCSSVRGSEIAELSEHAGHVSTPVPGACALHAKAVPARDFPYVRVITFHSLCRLGA